MLLITDISARQNTRLLICQWRKKRPKEMGIECLGNQVILFCFSVVYLKVLLLMWAYVYVYTEVSSCIPLPKCYSNISYTRI